MTFLQYSIALCFSITTGCFAHQITLGVPSSALIYGKNHSKAAAQYQKFKKSLEEKTHWKIKLKFYGSYAAAKNWLIHAKTDVVFSKIYPYMTARRCRAKITPIAAALEWDPKSKKLSPYYSAYIITKKSYKNIRSIKDLKNTNFGFVNRFSASGFIYAMHYFKSHHINYRQFFNSSQLFDSQVNLLNAIKKGKVKAGSVWAGIFNYYSIKPFRIIAIIHNIPTPLFIATSKLNKMDIRKLQLAMVSLPKSVFAPLAFKGLVKPDIAKYNSAEPIDKKSATGCNT